MRRRILVLGGYGAVGRQVSATLAAETSIECVIAGRTLGRAQAVATALGGAGAIAVDTTDSGSLDKALGGAYAVVNAAGPFAPSLFHGADYTVAERCAERGIHYVDLAGAHEHVVGIGRLDRKARQGASLVVAGASLLPAVSSILIDTLAPEFDHLDEIHVVVALGDTGAIGPACLHDLLSGIGRPLRLKERNRWRESYGWSEPATMALPEPVGHRRTYLWDAADLELFPQRYAARTVSCRTALPRGRLARGLAALAWLKGRQPIANLPRAVRLLGGGGRGRAGKPQAAGVSVLVRGRREGAPSEHAIHLIARNGSSAALVAAPAIALVKKWLREGVGVAGAVPCTGLLGLADLKAGLAGSDTVLVRA